VRCVTQQEHSLGVPILADTLRDREDDLVYTIIVHVGESDTIGHLQVGYKSERCLLIIFIESLSFSISESGWKLSKDEPVELAMETGKHQH
jgi:hypothetical protein